MRNTSWTMHTTHIPHYPLIQFTLSQMSVTRKYFYRTNPVNAAFMTEITSKSGHNCIMYESIHYSTTLKQTFTSKSIAVQTHALIPLNYFRFVLNLHELGIVHKLYIKWLFRLTICMIQLP